MTCILGAVFILFTLLALLITPRDAEAAPNITVQNSLLQISEYMSSNTAYPDAEGNFCDWVELHNVGRKALSLSGYALTDGNNTWMLPAMQLEPDGYLVIFCDGEGKKDLHSNLKLKAARRGNFGNQECGRRDGGIHPDHLPADQYLRHTRRKDLYRQ